MSATELLARLDDLGVLLVADADKLKVNAARGQLDDALKQAISAHKAELLELVAGRQDSSRPATAQPIPRIAREARLPLSHFQERLWVMQRLDSGSTAFNLVASWLAPRGVDADRVALALGAVLARHENLRSTFVDERGSPRVRLLDAPNPVETIDLRDLPDAAQRARLEADARAAAVRPWELAREAPARGIVYRLGDAQAVVLLAAHHVALDAWSIGLLAREVEARCADDAPAQEAPELQYADYVAWERRNLEAEAIAPELAWWMEKLRGAPELSCFPPDLAGTQRPVGATVGFTLERELTAGLHALARSEGATMYMALLAACAAVLRAHTGQGDVVLGSPTGERERPELESMIGPFVNLRVLRLDLQDDPGFAQLVGRARDAVLDAHAHGRVPFELLVERLKPARSFRHGPLFQVAVVQHNAPPREGLAIFGGGALHDLTWFAREVEGRLECALEYRSDLYSAAAIERIARHLQALVRSAVADPRRPVGRISLLDAAERERQLRDFNATALELDTARFSEQFERRAALAPGRVAVSFEGRALSYGQLNASANRLARHLRALGVGPGRTVGVCLERSPDLVVALLAIQKAGGAYVPLDPGFPAERLAFMLEDSEAGVLLTAGDARSALDVPGGVKIVDLGTQAGDWQALDGANLPGEGSAADPVYVIYTSGSTGRPKGVVVPHGALANFLGSMAREPGLREDDVVAAVTTISFDIAGLELYLPLLVGARIELVSRETATDGTALARALADSGATVLQATPATWRMLLEAGWHAEGALRAFCGGEALPRELADPLLERVTELWNLYGPTETTIWSTVERVMPGPQPVTIGRPIANTQVYVVGGDNEPVPIGMPGEIWIGGAGVALGYHRRPDLQHERFVADPFSSAPHARAYRTGDLGRWDASGRLHHLGRLDHQVKIRGFRIELGEVEAVLAAHPAVRECLVMAREAARGDARLVAYVGWKPGEVTTVSDVRRFMRRKLPDYMVPSVVVALDSMPLTPNGKVDRAALPDPFRNTLRPAASDDPPAPGAEQLLAGFWKDLLEVDSIGAQDNFFELGGHSLLSLRAAAAVEARTGWRMDPRTLFFQSLRQVAAAMPREAASGRGARP